MTASWQRYFKRWNEYPNFEAEGAYTSLYILKTAIERANKLVGGWPDEEAIISQLEGLGMDSPAGYLYIRPDNHQGYKDTVTGFSKRWPNIRSRSSTPTGSSPFRSATSARRRTGRSPARPTTS